MGLYPHNSRIHIRNPNKGPRFLNQVPTLPVKQNRTNKPRTPITAQTFRNPCETLMTPFTGRGAQAVLHELALTLRFLNELLGEAGVLTTRSLRHQKQTKASRGSRVKSDRGPSRMNRTLHLTGCGRVGRGGAGRGAGGARGGGAGRGGGEGA